MNAFARRLEEARARSGLGKSELAARAGVSPSYLSFLTSGRRRNPSLEVARRLATALGVSLDWLYRGERSAYAALAHVPVLGVVPAGRALPPITLEGEETPVPANIARRRPDYALWVRGDSMTDAGIADGALVFIRRQPLADPGAVVVAEIGGEVTLKRLRITEDAFVLEPGNVAYDPIRTRDARIVGVCVGTATAAPP